MTADLTVVIPVRNGAAYLHEALTSVLEQSLPPAHVVVVDDGSTDASADVARAVGAEVIHVGSADAGAGTGAARNAGARRATTSLLAFLDADDLSTPDRFALQVAALEEDPDLDGVLGHVRHFLTPERAKELADRHAMPTDAMPGWHAGTLMVRRASFDATGGWSNDVIVHEAFDWFAIAREKGLRFRVLDEVVMERRIHGDNLSVVTREEMRARYLRSARAAIVRRAAEQ